jgi:hypothetical protein
MDLQDLRERVDTRVVEHVLAKERPLRGLERRPRLAERIVDFGAIKTAQVLDRIRPMNGVLPDLRAARYVSAYANDSTAREARGVGAAGGGLAA